MGGFSIVFLGFKQFREVRVATLRKIVKDNILLVSQKQIRKAFILHHNHTVRTE